jgi:hypothetical protein
MKTTKEIIHNNLLEAKEKKSKVLNENKVISSRYNIIVENRTVNGKKNLSIISEQIINETIYLNSQGYSKELIQEGILDFISNIFGASGSGIWQMIKSRLTNKLIERLGINPNTWQATFVKEAFANINISDVPKLLTDCSFTTKLLTKTIVETLIVQLTNKKDGTKNSILSDILRQSFVEALEKTDVGQRIESSLAKIVCSLIHGIGENLEKFSDNVKQNIVTNPTNKTTTPTTPTNFSVT